MKIKRMSSDDLKEHFNDFLLLFAENTRGHVVDQKIEDDYILLKAKDLIGYLNQDTAVLFGNFIKEKLVGFIWAYPRVFLEENRIYINALIIDSKYRGKGFGQMLVQEVEKYAQTNNIFVVDVSTASFKEDAINFYEKIGYVSERVQLRKSLKKI